MIGLSQIIEHGAFEERDCAFVNTRFEGMIILECDEGRVNMTAEGCFPRRCLTYSSISVQVGLTTVGIQPLAIIASGEYEERLCRTVNPIFRNMFLLICDHGALRYDISECVSQWFPLEDPPWTPRSRHMAVGLSDGALLMMGGMGLTGPLQEVWQWSPDQVVRMGGLGVAQYDFPGWLWERARTPPWTGRFGAAVIRQILEDGEQVMLLGGNDGQPRNDVWRWLRDSARVPVPLYEDGGIGRIVGDATGTQPGDCEISPEGVVLVCNASVGVSGRRWYIYDDTEPGGLQFPSAIQMSLKYSSAAATGFDTGAARVILHIDDCRYVLEFNGGQWSSRGCAGDGGASARVLGWYDSSRVGRWQDVSISLDRANRQVVLTVDGQVLKSGLAPPGVGSNNTTADSDMGNESNESNESHAEADAEMNASNRDDNDSHAEANNQSHEEANHTAWCSPLLSEMYLYVLEVVAWPGSAVEVRDLMIVTAPGHWQRLAEESPWQPRSAHAVAELTGGDLLLMGGSGVRGLLNDVWRWTADRCTLLEMQAAEAARYELECVHATCSPSHPYGQWRRLSDAPWSARQGLAAAWTSAGVVMSGGRTAQNLESDVWRWQESGDMCSYGWHGHWEQLVAVGFPPRYGHSLIVFPAREVGAPETALVAGGFGGIEAPDRVTPTWDGTPVRPLNDLWCGSVALGNYSEWREFTPVAPFSARSQAAAVIAPTMSDYSMVFFGGYDRNARHRNDFWRWNGENTSVPCQIDELS